MKWLLISNGYDFPQHNTSFYYYNYVKPMMDALGLPYQLSNDTEIKFENNDILVHLVNKTTLERVQNIIIREGIQLIIETFKDKPSGLVQTLKNKPTTFGVCLSQNTTYAASEFSEFDEVWGFHSSFPNKIPEGLFLENYTNYQLEKKIDVSYIGTASDEKADVLVKLNKDGIDIRIWGYGWEKYKDLRHISRGFLPHWEKQKIIAQSKYSIYFTKDNRDNKNKYNEILASGGVPVKIDLVANNAVNCIKNNSSNDDARKIIDTRSFIDSIKNKISHYLPAVRLKSKKSSSHKLSIVCPVNNQEKYIEQMVLSVLGQSYKNFEFIILDDGSTDSTANIIKKYCHDRRIRYIYQENIGKNLDAFDQLIQILQHESNSTYIARMDGDDIMYPDRIQKQIELFEQNSNTDIVYTNYKGIKNAGFSNNETLPFQYNRQLPSKVLARELFNTNFISHPSIMMKKKSVEEMGGFQTPFASDLYFWIHSSPYLNYAYIESPTILYRYHDKGASTGKAKKSPLSKETYNVLMRSRAKYTILNYYEEIENCSNKDEAIYEAYMNFSTKIALARVFNPEIVIQNSWRALEHKADGLEAINHLLIATALDEKSDIQKVFTYIEKVMPQLQSQKKYLNFNNKLSHIKKDLHANVAPETLLKHWMNPPNSLLSL